MIKQRLYWIDWAKCIGIFFVILGHMKINDKLLIYIYSFHMPLFFFISGFLTIEQPIEITIKTGFNRLIKPYFYFFIITLLWYVLITNPIYSIVESYQNYFEKILEIIISFFLGVGYSTDISTMITPPLWFLIGLFFCKIISNIMRHFFFGISLVIFSFMFSILMSILREAIQFDLYLSIDSVIMALPFFNFGYYLRSEDIAFIPSKKILCIIILLLGLLISFITSQINGYTDINRCIPGRSIILYYCIAIIGIYSITILSYLLHNYLRKATSFISSGTIVILALHQICSGVLFTLTTFQQSKFGNQLIITVSCLLILCIPIFLINKFTPFILGKR